MSFVVVHARVASADVLSIIGDLDLATAPRLVSCGADALRRGARHLVLDLQEVPFVDSAGLASLINLLRRADAAGSALVLACPRTQLSRLLTDTRMERHFLLADTVEQGERLAAAA